jgi:hypothetical protein
MQANRENILDVIQDAYRGRIVIPEFQRSFVWSRDDIEELLVSIMQGYFIGTFLLLETSRNSSPVPFRYIEGLEELRRKQSSANLPNLNHPMVRLVLDGQQRITALFYVLYEPPIELRRPKRRYYFYFLFKPALEGEIEQAVVSADERDKNKMDNLVQDYKAVPFSWFKKEISELGFWLIKSVSNQKLSEEKIKQILSLVHQFKNFEVPIVTLSAETPIDDIVNIFERINRTGVVLSLFDLVAARLYLKEIRLRDLWDEFCESYPKVSEVIKPEFLLKIITIWKEREPKRQMLFDVIDSLDKSDFEQLWRRAAYFIVKAYERVTATQGGYGAFRDNLIPYATMLVPLAVLLEAIEDRSGGEEMYRKLDKWYWASVFTQRYDSAVDTKAYQDVRDIKCWIEGDDPPEWLANLSVNEIDVDVSQKGSAIYRGLMCLVVLEGARDFRTGQPANLNECQDDHIFPKARFKNEKQIDSILNRTLIDRKTNWPIKRDKMPSEYLSDFLREHHGDEKRFLETLRSHLITCKAYEAMKSDNFQKFIEARRQAFIQKLQEKLKD